MNKEEIKCAVTNLIANGRTVRRLHKSKVRIDNTLLHIRYCSRKSSYPYNINPNTLKSDYEVWICADPDHYYLIPTILLKSMYEDPTAYIDKHHPEIRVVSLNPSNHNCSYARGGKHTNLQTYFLQTFSS